MIRKAAAVVVVLCLSSASLHADSAKLTVSAASASVYKSPSVGSPVIGQAARGTALEVTREVGDWVKVSWPKAPEGFGYVRANMGQLSHANTAASARPAASTTARPATAAGSTPARPLSASAVATPAQQQPLSRPSAPTPAKVIQPPTHTLGFGGTMGGSTFALGGSARGWSRSHIGAQLDVSHYSMTSPIEVGTMTATQLAPSVLYAMKDHITDRVWLRPYVGVGAAWSHATLSEVTPGFTTSANTLGARVFVGSEFMFANVPQFGLSLDGGYYHMPDPFVGFEPKGIGAAVSLHWYVK